jgi:hypothetical protein
MANPLDYDKFGHCVSCSKNMVVEVAINGKIENRFTPEYNEVSVTLNDNSKMRICMCNDCKIKFSSSNYSEVMTKIHNSWEKETKELDWDEKRKDDYINKQKELSIVSENKGEKQWV